MRRTAPVLALTLVLSACGITSEGAQTSGPSQTVAPTTLRSAEPEATPADDVVEPTPTTELATTSADPAIEETTTTAESVSDSLDTPPEELALDGALYVDPDNKFSIVVPPGWDDDISGIPDGVQAWYVGPIDGDVAPNVNILTLPSFGLSTEAYTDLGVESLGDEDFDVLELSTVVASAGHTMTRLEMTNGVLDFLQYSFVNGDDAITMTLTAPTGSFDQYVADLDPYLLTLGPA